MLLSPRIPNRLLAGWLLLAATAGLLAALLLGLLPIGDSFAIIGAATLLTATAALMVPGGLRQARELQADHQRLSSENLRMLETLQQKLERHRKLEAELKDAKKQTEAAMMAKGEFLATMSHEIRTPLNGILPVLDMLMAAKLTSDQAELLRTAHGSAKQMLRLVDDILDYSKLEANKVDLEVTGFHLRELTESVVRLLTKQAETKGILIHLEFDPQLHLSVRGDPTRLRQVLTNLLSNAIKFTDRGRVSLRIRRLGDLGPHQKVRFEVIDTGIGIATDKLSQLFSAFSQADASTTRMYGGTGLGLVICKRIITLMEGSIGVESQLGQGSCFWFEIPLLKAVGILPATRSGLAGPRILLMTAEVQLRERLAQALQNWGMRPGHATTPTEALQLLRAGAARGSSGRFDALVADLRDGPSTAQVLLRALSLSPELEGLKLVFLGNQALPEDVLQGGQAILLRRETSTADLRQALTGLLVAEPAGGLPSAPHTEGAFPALDDFPLKPKPKPKALASDASVGAFAEAAIGRRARVLLVEDNPVNLLVAQKLISAMDLICESAGDGERALERIAAGNLDLVLMDCQMPVKDGYTATREWRQYETAHGLPRLPILAMTANAMAGDRQRCLDAGMDDYLSKPIDRTQLEELLRRWLQRGSQARRRASSDPARAAASSVPVPVPTHAARSPMLAPNPRSGPPPAETRPPAPAVRAEQTEPVLDDSVLAELRGIMGEEFPDLVRMFLGDARKYLLQLEEAAGSGDLAAMVAPAHTLKSSSANLGAMAVSAAARRIEVGARAGNLQRPAVAVALLEAEFQHASAKLRELSA